ncbi:ACP S-malonyltransferase [Pedobacter rhodius]|uniref:Malonyl CoA-acyl carrier protein transacylase n=1 Tax=Pedobacter rhodius TaxID=3004098 RepID=A0ABT4L1N1_9SPHI|nr:malonate decarboxylase subunit epsilon [Pedobacter sp. SJ11]MCZ4225101.1 malonate decarboxylase subunit epsilon [Pedobacter sp. SJ11]
MKTAFLFPGQSSQQPGMLSTLPVDNPEVAPFIQAAEHILGRKISTIDTDAALFSTVNVQLALLISGVISAKRILAGGVHADFVAGHSIGAFSAAVISGVIRFDQAIKLVDTRARLMEQAFPSGYGMAALLGFTQNRLLPYLEIHNKKHAAVYLSNINAKDQLVVSGELNSLTALIGELQKAGIQKTKILDVSVPSHCRLLSGISDVLKKQLGEMELKAPLIPFASNTTGRLLKTAEAISADLSASISSPVQWYDATTLIYEMGARIFVEMEPSGVLSKIATATFPEAKVISANEDQLSQLVDLWKIYQEAHVS